MRRTLVSIATLVAFAACSSPTVNEPEPGESPEFDRATVVIDTDGNSVLMYVDIAENAQQRAYGLMNRTTLPEDEGMVFLYFEPTTEGLGMKNTLIPLSVAFFDAEGRILEILDMEPCPPKSKSCPVYEPGVTYLGALEVNQGAFAEAGVEEGDVIEIVPGAE